MRISIRHLAMGLSLIALVLLTTGMPGTFTAGASATRSTVQMAKPGGPITIESWLQLTPDKNGLSGIALASFKLKGAFVDQNGAPKWTDLTYASPTSKAEAAAMCGDPHPAGGFVMVPVKGADTTVYAVHTITGQKGALFITFSGTYDFAKTYQGSGTWVITGGTGASTGVIGSGTWKADARFFPYVRHTEVGTLYYQLGLNELPSPS
jgi:hypothetical protein